MDNIVESQCPFECNENDCFKRFATKKELEEHIKEHKKICAWCGKSINKFNAYWQSSILNSYVHLGCFQHIWECGQFVIRLRELIENDKEMLTE